jgi:hypothetical protein
MLLRRIAGRSSRGRLVGVLVGLLVASPAFARDRLAVLMIAGDPALADNLVEVAIAHLTKRGDWELVGERELRGRLAEILPAGGLGACVAQPSCLAALGAAAQAPRVVLGDVARSGDAFVVDLTLANTQTGATEARSSTTIPADEPRLIAAIRGGIDDLLPPKSPPPRGPALTVIPAAPAEPAPRPSLELRRYDDVPVVRRGSVLPYVGSGAGAVAVISFSAAAVTGSFATAALTPGTRAQMQADLHRRDDYATTANILIGTGTVFAVVAAVAFYRWRRGERAVPHLEPRSTNVP